MRLDSVWRNHEEHRIISCKYKLTNTGDESTSVRRVFPRFVFSSAEYELYSQLNRWGLENRGAWQTLSGAGLVLKARTARSTVSSTPFCALRNTETQKAVAFHVVPKGDWVIKVFPLVVGSEDPLVVIELGLSDEDLFFKLPPGESIDLPEIILQEIPDGQIEKSAAPLHRYLNDVHLKDTKLNRPPVIYNTWLYRFESFTMEQLRQQLAAAKTIGCEYFVVDAGWFGSEGDGWNSVGDWREKTESAFFGEMKSFADEVRNSGLKFGLWMEPERYAENIPIRKEHGEWFPENSSRIDLTVPDAADYFFNSIKDVIERYGVEYLKMDFNSPDSGYDESGTHGIGSGSPD